MRWVLEQVIERARILLLIVLMLLIILLFLIFIRILLDPMSTRKITMSIRIERRITSRSGIRIACALLHRLTCHSHSIVAGGLLLMS